MFVLSKEPNKQEYLDHMGEVCKLGRYEVTVGKYVTDTKTGSWERGFKFHETTYGVLYRTKGTVKVKSFDHGKSWEIDWVSDFNAAKLAGRNKIMLKRKTTKEFAFDAIQRINRQYDAGYRW